MDEGIEEVERELAHVLLDEEAAAAAAKAAAEQAAKEAEAAAAAAAAAAAGAAAQENAGADVTEAEEGSCELDCEVTTGQSLPAGGVSGGIPVTPILSSVTLVNPVKQLQQPHAGAPALTPSLHCRSASLPSPTFSFISPPPPPPQAPPPPPVTAVHASTVPISNTGKGDPSLERVPSDSDKQLQQRGNNEQRAECSSYSPRSPGVSMPVDVAAPVPTSALPLPPTTAREALFTAVAQRGRMRGSEGTPERRSGSSSSSSRRSSDRNSRGGRSSRHGDRRQGQRGGATHGTAGASASYGAEVTPIGAVAVLAQAHGDAKVATFAAGAGAGAGAGANAGSGAVGTAPAGTPDSIDTTNSSAATAVGNSSSSSSGRSSMDDGGCSAALRAMAVPDDKEVGEREVKEEAIAVCVGGQAASPGQTEGRENEGRVAGRGKSMRGRRLEYEVETSVRRKQERQEDGHALATERREGMDSRPGGKRGTQEGCSEEDRGRDGTPHKLPRYGVYRRSVGGTVVQTTGEGERRVMGQQGLADAGRMEGGAEERSSEWNTGVAKGAESAVEPVGHRIDPGALPIMPGATESTGKLVPATGQESATDAEAIGVHGAGEAAAGSSCPLEDAAGPGTEGNGRVDDGNGQLRGNAEGDGEREGNEAGSSINEGEGKHGGKAREELMSEQLTRFLDHARVEREEVAQKIKKCE